ncbi:hypothetical protein FHP25_27310 [Vineibacter terrae]|uniref:Uncharacterized protein n=1 Tax=Vineibacter terrae TaxID=2586908 RepID=A0A5C8PDV9_9HYPH|nr:hypothetical protein [Vineibacter terrae]TXL71947.1 hypothetical protein FHP25_27310 [Vineibacter terrae]
MDLAFYNFTINPVGLAGATARQYVSQVHEHLRWIYRTTSGRILLNVIRRPTFPVEIRPYTGTDCNSVGGGEYKTPGKLTGFVAYSPSTFSSHGVCSALPAAENRGRLWDEILFHELVHVFRNATGKWNKGPALSYAMRHYDDNEEFIAVLCTNIYVADRTNKIKTGLRASHQGYKAMDPADAMRFGLFASSRNAYALVKKFCDDNPIFTKALSDKLPDVIYNPIADYYRFPKICEALSIFGTMKDRAALAASLTAAGLPKSVVDLLVSLAT